MSEIGHNSNDIDGDQLRSFIDRIERLEGEKAELTTDIRDIYAEAKGSGFDVKIMRQVVRLRRMDSAERGAAEAMRDCYMDALGMLAGTPLGQAAIEREFGQTSLEPVPPRFPVVRW